MPDLSMLIFVRSSKQSSDMDALKYVLMTLILLLAVSHIYENMCFSASNKKLIATSILLRI